MASFLANIFGGKKKSYKAADVYLGLRRQVFTMAKEASPTKPEESFAILMETGMKDICYTLVAVSDGTASLYFSNGGGILGSGEHKAVAEKVKEFLEFSKNYEPLLQKVTEYPLPEPGRTRFYIAKYGGSVLSSEASENDLGEKKSPLSPLFSKAHELIAIMRWIDEKKSEPPLILAVLEREPEQVHQLLDSGANPNSCDSKGIPALFIAVMTEQEEVVGMLLKAGADPKKKITDQELGIRDAPASCFAVENENTAILEMLLNAGADLEGRDAMGMTLLMQAANTGKTKCAELLLNLGADIHARDKDDSRPIMFAAQYAYNDIVRLLLARGADPNVIGSFGISAIGIAMQNGHSETVRILKGEVS